MAVPAVILVLICGTSRADDFPGFSVTPPSPADWMQVQRNAFSIVWMRRTGNPDLSVGVAVLTQSMSRVFESPAQFIEWVTLSKEANPDPGRFRLVSNQVAPADGEGLASCARYSTVIEDSSGGPDAVLRLEVAGLACLHPEQPGRYFDVQYSARMPTGESFPEAMVREGQAFVDSFRFAAPPPGGDWSLGPATPAPGRRQET
jgi:hypothetical protein